MCFRSLLMVAAVALSICSQVYAQEFSRASEPRASADINLLAPKTYVVPLPSLPADIPQIGEGFDLLTGERRSTSCIAHGGLVVNAVESIQSSLSEVTDDEMLYRKLSTSIEAKAKFGGYSGGGSYSETNETRTSTSKVSVVAKATHITTATNLLPSSNAIPIGFLPSTRIDLTAAAYNMVANGRFADFRRTCGDGYVAQIALGGQFLSTLEFSKLDFEQKRSVVASVSAAGPGDAFSASGNSNLQQEMTKRSSSLRIEYSQQGGEFKMNPTTQNELKEAYKKFPEVVRMVPRMVFISVVRYESLGAMAALPNKTQAYWIYADQAIRQLLRLQSVRNDIASMLQSNNSESGLPPDPNVEFVYLKEIEDKGYLKKGLRSLKHQKDNLQELQKLTKELGQWLGNCLNTATEKSCTPPDSSFSRFDDLVWRARAPLARADIRTVDENELRALAGLGSFPTLESACYLGEIIRSNVIRRIAAVRQKYDNAGDEEKTAAAESEVLTTLGVTEMECINFASSARSMNSKLDINASMLPRP